MRKSSDIARGVIPGKVQDRLTKRYELESKYLTDNAQSDPIKILFGRDFLSLSLLTPIFDLKTRESDSGGGKASSKGVGSTGQTYYGGFAGGFCIGPVAAIHAIHESDKEVEKFDGTGLLLGDDAEAALWDSTNKYYTLEIPNYGTIRIHQGTATQPIDPRFTGGSGIVINPDDVDSSTIPATSEAQTAYRNIFYIATDDFKLGTSNTTPNLRIEVSCTPKCFKADYPAFFAGETPALKVADEEGDVYPPLIVYEYLRNSTWGGAGLAVSDIDYQSFIDATEQCISEGIAITALQDSSDTSVRDAISQILQYCDGALYLNDSGQVAIKLVRYDDGETYPEITTDDLADEPELNWSGVNDTWGRTEIIFNSRVDSYESTAEVFESPRYTGSELRQINEESISLPFCKKRALAAKLARRFGNAGATPSCEVSMRVLPGGDYEIGDLIRLTYEKFGVSDLLLRINSITYGSPAEPIVSITAVSEPVTAWDIEIQNVIGGYQKKQDPVTEVTGGFLKPRLLLLSDEGDGNKIAGFVERNESAPIVHYNVLGRGTYNGVDYDFEIKGNKNYQTKVLITELEQSGNQLRLSIAVEGDQRKRELETLQASIRSQTLYLTCAAFQNDELTLRPMSFRVLGIENNGFAGDIYSYFLSVATAQIFDNWVYPSSTDGGFKPSTVGYLHKLSDNKSEVFTFTSDSFKILFNETNSHTYFQADFGNSITEERPCAFQQLYASSAYTHQLMTAQGEIGQEQWTELKPWGDAAPIDGTVKIASQTTTPVIPAGGGELSYFWLNPVTGENKVYTENGWELVDNSNVLAPLIPPEQIPFGSAADEVARGNHLHDERYQLIGDSAERYYRSFSSSASLNHVRGSDGRVHVHLIDEIPITITLPSIAEAEDGDMITVFLTAANGVEQDVVTVMADEDEVFSGGQNEVIVGTGTILQLVCVEDGWMPILKSILEI